MTPFTRVAVLSVAVTLSACAADPPAAVVGVRATGCGIRSGTGTFVDDDLVLTAAHTVAGATDVSVLRDGTAQPAELVAFDAALDLAVLRADGPPGRPLPRTTANDVGRGTAATVWAYRDGTAVRVPVTVVRPVTVRTTDIHHEGRHDRPGLELAGPIEPGDSGAPVVVAGQVVGVVWSRSVEVDGRAWAVAPVTMSGVVDATRCDR